jgi:large subunit ribosomal protein L28
MSRVCPITGKGPVSGNNRSHSVVATRRVWNVNLQKYKIEVNGQMVEVRMSARAYRTLNKSVKAKAAEAPKDVTAPKAEVKAEAKPVETKPVEAAKPAVEEKPAKKAAPKAKAVKAEKPEEKKADEAK